MSDFNNVLFERMRPAQVAERRRMADVAFLPLGNLEWHGIHNPLGLDGIKAHNACCRAARLLDGGAVFPTVLWGVPRDSFNVGIAGDAAPAVAKALGVETKRWQGFAQHGGMDVQEQWRFYQRLLRMALEHIAGFGFRSIYICSGHGPFIHWIKPVAITFTRASKMADALVTTDWGNVYEIAGLGGDHGGRHETSSMMTIDPAMVDLGELERNPEYEGVGAGSNAREATAEAGREWLDASAAAMADEARWLVENYPAAPERHKHRR